MTRDEWTATLQEREFVEALRTAVGHHPWRATARDIALVVAVLALVGVGISLGKASSEIASLHSLLARHEEETQGVCAAQERAANLQFDDVRRRLDNLERRIR